MKRGFRKASVFAFFVFLATGLSFTAVGDAEMPKWNIGDTWNYEASITNRDISFTYEVTDLTTVNVNGTNYEVYVTDTVMKMTMTIPGSDDITVTSTGNVYYLSGNLAIVRTELSLYTEGHVSTMITTYDPPFVQLDFPLEVGKSWTTTYKISIYRKYDGVITSYNNETINVTSTVEGIENKEVEAGTFECYKIKLDDGSGTVSYSWYSPNVKNMVATSAKGTGIETELKLASYNEASLTEFDLFAMPYILLLIIIPVIIVILIIVVALSRKRKKAAEAAAAGPAAKDTTSSAQIPDTSDYTDAEPPPPSDEELPPPDDMEPPGDEPPPPSDEEVPPPDDTVPPEEEPPPPEA